MSLLLDTEISNAVLEKWVEFIHLLEQYGLPPHISEYFKGSLLLPLQIVTLAFCLFSFYIYRKISKTETSEKVEQVPDATLKTSHEVLEVPLPPSPEKTSSTQEEDIIDVEKLDEDTSFPKSILEPVRETVHEEENSFEFTGEEEEEEEEEEKENVPLQQNTLPPLELKPKTKASPRTRIKLEEAAITPQKRPTRVIRSPYRYSPDGFMVSNDSKRKSIAVKVKLEEEEEEVIEKVKTRSSVRTEEKSSPRRSPRKSTSRSASKSPARKSTSRSASKSPARKSSSRSASKSPARKKKAETSRSTSKSPVRSRKEVRSPRSPSSTKSPGRGTPGKTRGRRSELERLLS